ncbi:MAG: hypothetical protein ACE5F1_13755, partial [Planctomycetota bacterium]
MDFTSRPRLRMLEAVPVKEPGKEGILLLDPEGLIDGQIFVPEGLLPVIACLTGERSIQEIASHLSEKYQQAVGP